MRTPARRRRGVTLIEIMVGTAIALIMTAAAVVFATQETKLMDVSREKLRIAQVGRAAIGLLADDLRKAGAGVGYSEAGVFLGLSIDSFTAGGLAWNPSGTATGDGNANPGVSASNTFSRRDGSTYTVNTHDVGVRFASGSYATVVEETGGIGTICTAPDVTFDNGELAILRDQTGISARLGTVTLGGALGGANCPCVNGCRGFTFTTIDDRFTGPGAQTVRFGLGELQGGMQTVVWFVTENGGVGELRRAEFDGGANCADRPTCGGVVAYDTEALFARVWRWDDVIGAWVPTGGTDVDEREARLRIDVELVLRSESETEGFQPEVVSRVRAGECMPGPCGAASDDYARAAYRTSVEIMNSGMMQVR